METNQQNDDLIFSDDQNKGSGKVVDNFIDDTNQEESELSFYKKLVNQTKYPKVATLMKLFYIPETCSLNYMQLKIETKSFKKFKSLKSHFLLLMTRRQKISSLTP